MKMEFTKMHGTGNDYVYVNCMEQELPNPGAISEYISHRRFGIGSDGLIMICKSDVADFKMRIFNADASEAKMCGNGSRCIAKYVYDKGLTKQLLRWKRSPVSKPSMYFWVKTVKWQKPVSIWASLFLNVPTSP